MAVATPLGFFVSLFHTPVVLSATSCRLSCCDRTGLIITHVAGKKVYKSIQLCGSKQRGYVVRDKLEVTEICGLQP